MVKFIREKMRRKATLFILLLANATFLSAQSRIKVSGTVNDAENEPLIGVSIAEKGTVNGTVTDVNGQYTLSVKEGATIVYSYIGYISQERTAANGVLNVTLTEDTKSLDEVIVIGYGVQKKSNVTGAISSVKSEDLIARSVTDVGSALQGKTSGIQVINTSGSPGAAAALRIRGFSSNGISDPLYVVDGLKVPDLSSVDIENIESIEILKDGASAAIYGAEAGNGVVLITSKTGKKGAGKIFVNTQHSFSKLAKKFDLLGAQDFITYQIEAGTRSLDEFNMYYYNDPSSYINNKLVDTDWQDVAYNTGYMQRYTLGFQGGNDKGSLYMSLGYLDHNGIITGSKDSYNRVNGQINASYKIKDWIDVGVTNSIEVSKLKSMTESDPRGQSFTTNLYDLDPLTPVEYSDGLRGAPVRLQKAVKDGYSPAVNPKTGNYYSAPYFSGLNALSYLERDNRYTDIFQINGTAYANLTPLKNFVLTSRLGYRFMNYYEYEYTAPYWQNESVWLNKNPELEVEQKGSYYYQWENFGNYLLKFGEHDFTMMAGMSFTSSKINAMGTRTDELTNLAPNFQYLDYSAETASDFIEGNTTEARQIAYFGRFGWDYAGKYNIQVNFRADSYDAAFLDLEHNWGYFPSVSAGWTLSNEEFMQNINKKMLSFAKLRASYGKNGSISNLGGYMYASVLNTGNNYYMDGKLITGTYPSEYLANSKLKWEESVQLDLGFDLRMFNDRLLLGFDYYNKNTEGLLVQSVAPLVTGTSFIWQNVGKVNNHGFEVELEWRDKVTDKFSYSVKGNIATVNNKVTQYKGEGVRLGGSETIRGSQTGQQVSYIEEGYPVWYLRGYVFEGVNPADGSPVYKDVVPDGQITDADKEMIGSGIPDFTYGATVSLKYGNFDLMAFGAGSYGNELMYAMQGPGIYTGNRPQFFFDQRWTADNPNSKRPTLIYQREEKFVYSSANVFDASYFKIKQIQLGYTLPDSWLSAVKVSSLRIYASLDDFFIFTKYPGQDPETRPNATSGMAIDYGGYPIAKSVMVGVNLNF
jgi:TonB-linked SusC/RagA family outer membrane protein